LPAVTALTVNEITTRKERIAQLINLYNPTIESMEGAALHYVCNDLNIPYLQIRGLSNYIGERDKSKWKIKEAVENANKILVEIVMGRVC
jgi:futalosine hydrolase